jgi:hypothetical protein
MYHGIDAGGERISSRANGVADRKGQKVSSVYRPGVDGA